MKTETDMRLPGDLLIESSIDVMIAVGTDDSIAAWNSAASFLFDLPREKAIGKSLFNVLPSMKDDTDLQTALRFARHGKKSFLAATPELIHRHHVETHVIPLQHDNIVAGVMLLMHDVSHRIAKELELQRLNEELQNRLRQLHLTSNELTQLTHIASHNIRGPIREIYTTVEGLLRTEAGVISNHGRASFRRIQSSLNKMNLLLDDITTLTQISISDVPHTIVKIGELLDELKMQLARKLQDSKTILTTGDLCEIRAHRSQVLLLLQHIFSNIMKSAFPNPPNIHINCEKTQEHYLLSISHNGTAFDNIDLDKTVRISENSDVHNFIGPAIALVIASKIMEVHSGSLTIEKTGENESRINCYFPVK